MHPTTCACPIGRHRNEGGRGISPAKGLLPHQRLVNSGSIADRIEVGVAGSKRAETVRPVDREPEVLDASAVRPARLSQLRRL